MRLNSIITKAIDKQHSYVTNDDPATSSLDITMPESWTFM